MLALTATAEAKSAFHTLKGASPRLFAAVSQHLAELRSGDDPALRRGRVFRLDDDRTAHLVTFYDAAARCDLVLVWILDESGPTSAVKVIGVEHTR